MGHHLCQAHWTMLAFKSPIQMLGEGEDGEVQGRIQAHTGTQNFRLDNWFPIGTKVEIFLYKMLAY